MNRIAACALLFGLWSAAASAQANGVEKWFQALDTDGNGQVSKADLIAQKSKQFARMDQNGDGRLTATEIARIKSFLSRRAPDRADAFERSISGLDQNSDGVVSRNEYLAVSSIFSRADQNGDDIVSQAEVTALAASQ